MEQPKVEPSVDRRPRVTVMIITYNHAAYIAQAIDSVLQQKTDYPMAIHVIDDCSTDGAQDIIRDYAARYPGVVKPFINKVNIGSKVTQKNFHYGFSTLDGDYAAVLEGDDYWAWPERIQTQVDFLEANPDFVACSSNTLKIHEDGSQEPHLFQPAPDKDDHDIHELIMLSSFFHASSLTFRNVFRGKVPKYLSSPLSCDIFVTIAHAQFGKIRYFREVGSVYRAHSAGLFSQMTKARGWMWNIDSLRAFNRWLGFRYFATFTKSIFQYCDLLLINGKEEDGLTEDKRRFYTSVRKRYRLAERAFRRADLALAKWIPGRQATSAPARLNLGCGPRRYLRVYINADKRAEFDPDMVVDLERTPWPWPDNYAEEVLFEHSLEHMGADFETFQAMMRELYRICRPDARVVIKAKHPWTNNFAHDPTCVRVVSPLVLGLFDSQNITAEPFAARNKVDFELIDRTVLLAEPYRTQFETGQIDQETIVFLVDTSMNVCSDFQLKLVAHKPPRSVQMTDA